MKIDGQTSVPLAWVVAMVVFTIGAAGGLVKLGQYVGGRDAEGAEVKVSVSKLEHRTTALEGMESRIDRRLYRLEIERKIKVPDEDRIPGVK